MNWTVLWAQLKKLDKKIDDMETISLQKVDELPEVGEDNVIYFVPKETAEEGNYSDEYVWDSNLEEYEKIGDTIINNSNEIILYNTNGNNYYLPNNMTVRDLVSKIVNDDIENIPTIKLCRLYNDNPVVVHKLEFVRMADAHSLYQTSIQFVAIDSLISNGGTGYAYSVRLLGNDTKKYITLNEKSINAVPPKNTISSYNDLSDTNSSPTISLYGKMIINNIAAFFSSVTTYNKGDYVTYTDGKLFKCKENNVTGSWNSSKWEQVSISNILKTIPIDYAKDTAVTALYDSTATYELGDIVMYNKELYECTTAIPIAEEWDSTHWTKTDIFSQMPSGGGALSALSDVDLTNPSDEQDLVYSATLGKWINKTKVVTLTKAQYDALPSSKLTDGIMYYITDLDINDYAKDSSIADLYDNTSTYAVGDIVMFENELYKCTTAVSVAEDFDVNKWTSINVMDIIGASITSVLNTSF